MTTKEDFQTCIDAVDQYQRVFVDRYGDDQLWLSITVPGGSANCRLAFGQARELISAINRVMEAA